MNILRRIPRALLLAFLALALAQPAFAQKDKKKPNPYPNATRQEPKQLDIDERTSKKINEAYDALDAGEMDKVEKALNEVLAKKPSKYEEALAYQGLAQVHYDRDEIDQAIAMNQKALATNGLDNTSHFNLLYQIAQMQLMEERYDATLATVEQWFKLTGATDKSDAWALKGNALYRLDRFPEAAEAMKKAISLTDKPSDSLYQILIASYYDAENYPEAAKAAEQILAKDPGNKATLQQLSSIYLEMEQNDKAIALLENAYQKGVLSEEKDLKQLYQLYNYTEKPEQAARVISEGMAKGILKPSVDTHKGLADAYALQAEPLGEESAERKALLQKAADAYGEAAKLSPSDGELDMQRGHLLVEMERWADARTALTAALAKPNLKRKGEALILLGTAEYELGNEQAAIAAYQKAQAFPSTKSMADAWLKSVRGR
ncbi:MAG TPA: tetratricopeptide repeat protein [Xanthomonadales bacterium]|nr:tetratricopeptide repeat protein [Xanthomonadales bacterium]